MTNKEIIGTLPEEDVAKLLAEHIEAEGIDFDLCYSICKYGDGHCPVSDGDDCIYPSHDVVAEFMIWLNSNSLEKEPVTIYSAALEDKRNQAY